MSSAKHTNRIFENLEHLHLLKLMTKNDSWVLLTHDRILISRKASLDHGMIAFSPSCRIPSDVERLG
jgi:hypothetical protein